MNRRQIALELVRNQLGLSNAMDKFADRLILQKAIYLAQELGVAFGYHFSWYLRGPYSPDLTADAFANVGRSVPEGWALDGGTRQKLSKLERLIDDLPKGPNIALEFEKLASVLFVFKTRQGKDVESVTKRLTTAGKNYSQSEVRDALQNLRECDVLEQTENRR